VSELLCYMSYYRDRSTYSSSTYWCCKRFLATSDELALKRVYIVADEPIEERRKKVLVRMRDRAVRQGKLATVSEDGHCLYIDGVMVFSVSNGRINAPTSVINGSM